MANWWQTATVITCRESTSNSVYMNWNKNSLDEERNKEKKKTQRILGEEQGQERGEGTQRGYESERREKREDVRKRGVGVGQEGQRERRREESHGLSPLPASIYPLPPPSFFNGQIRDNNQSGNCLEREKGRSICSQMRSLLCTLEEGARERQKHPEREEHTETARQTSMVCLDCLHYWFHYLLYQM